jgi:selenocysteine-specific elongation factor
LFGDKLVVRDPATRVNLGAGRIIDCFAAERRVLRRHRAATLMAMGSDRSGLALGAQLEALGTVDMELFAVSRNMSLGEVHSLVDAKLLRNSSTTVLISPQRLASMRRRAIELLGDAHRRYPDRLGLDARQVADRLTGGVGREIGRQLIDELIEERTIALRGGLIHLPGHRPRPKDADLSLWERLRPVLADGCRRPPTVSELATLLGMDHVGLRSALRRLEHFGYLILVTRNRAFLPEAVRRLSAIAESLSGMSRDLFTAAEFNDRAGIGRNLSIELLEYLDGVGVTERLGDQRRVVSTVGLQALLFRADFRE